MPQVFYSDAKPITDPDRKNVNRFRNWILILIGLVFILIVVILALTIYLVVKTADNNKQLNQTPQALTTLSSTTSLSGLPSWPPPSNSPTGIFIKATAAADNGLCSDIGRNMLMKGGNAVDAAIAVLFCIGVTDPQSAGLGGGHFMTIYNKTTRTCTAIDAREVAPAAATKDMYENTTDGSQLGYLAVAVPSQLAGLWVAYQNFGSGMVEWWELIAPTIVLCEQGYPVSEDLADTMVEHWNDILNNSDLHIFINNKTGLPYKAGDIMTRPVFGNTLRKIANASDPVQLFYNSSMTSQIVQEMRAGGGIITEDDFRNYTVKWGEKDRPVVVTQLKGTLNVCGPPPPSSTAVTTAILNILDGYNITPDSLTTVEANVEVYHRLIEAMKFAYDARNSLADMDFVPNAYDVAVNLTTPWYGAYIRSKLLETAQNQSYYFATGPFTSLDDHGTSHMSVMDSDGNAVAATSTINLVFGAKVRSHAFDIIWNDEMDDFSQPNRSNFFGYPPSALNFIEPGKRPLSSMSPVVVYDSNTGVVKLVTGAAGGSTIISATSQILLRTLYFNQTVKEAVDSPRLHNQLEPFNTQYEPGFPNVYIQGLINRGQNMTLGMATTAVTTAILATSNGTIYSNSDCRKAGGFPAGY